MRNFHLPQRLIFTEFQNYFKGSVRINQNLFRKIAGIGDKFSLYFRMTKLLKR